MDLLKGGRIVVAVDGSKVSLAGLRCALELSSILKSKVTVLTVIQKRMPGYRAGYFSFVDRHILKELRDFAKGVIEESLKIAGEMGIEIDTTILETDKEIFEEIVDFLEKTGDISFVVMGLYGHSVHDRGILGSTTERLMMEVARRRLKVNLLIAT